MVFLCNYTKQTSGEFFFKLNLKYFRIIIYFMFVVKLKYKKFETSLQKSQVYLVYILYFKML